MSARVAEPSLALPIGGSLLLHASVIALVVMLRPGHAPALPPVYKVSIVAAPPGPRAIGTVQPDPPVAPPPTPTPPPKVKAKPLPKPAPVATKKVPAKLAPVVATPVPAKPSPAVPQTKAPAAGGGPQGGHGADVANVDLQGINFPFPDYLQTIVRQLALRFHPPVSGALRAEVVFLIHRDGSVTGFRFQTRSNVYSFDTEVQGAVEAAASARAFGPLPSAFPDDVLPVIFTFDPRIIR